MTATPIRTCVGCRKRAPASDLSRTVAVVDAEGDLRVVPDPAHRLPGRGAWLHARATCVEAATKRDAFRRALRISGRVIVDLDSLTRVPPASPRDRNELKT